jgi:hypothetical protein
MSEICVNGTTVKIAVDPPTILILATDIIGSQAQTIVKGEQNMVLLAADFNVWAATYVSPYTSPPYAAPGAVKGVRIVLSGLSTLTTINGEPVVLTSTTGVLTLMVTIPAMTTTPVPTPDTQVTKTAKITITSSAQTLVTSN